MAVKYINPLVNAFRSAGFALGGESRLRWNDDLGEPQEQAVPGGYVFASGDADSMRALLPLFRTFAEGRGFEETQREGWDAFYLAPDELANHADYYMPFFTGMKDGVFLIGCLSPETLDEKPQIAWPDFAADGGNDSRVFGSVLDVRALSAMLGGHTKNFNLKPLASFIEEQGYDVLLTARTYSMLLRALIGVSEAKEISLGMSGWDSVDLTVRTGEPDYRTVWELARGLLSVTGTAEQ
jgi:hypothetical protein